MKIHILVTLFLLLNAPLLAQQRRPGDKPVLIRPDEEKQEEEVITYDPRQAKEHVSIGDFYFRRENYKAAAERYRDAIRFNLQWDEPYEKLAEALAKMGEFEAAIEACGLYIENNPTGDKIDEFQKKVSELQVDARKK